MEGRGHRCDWGGRDRATLGPQKPGGGSSNTSSSISFKQHLRFRPRLMSPLKLCLPRDRHKQRDSGKPSSRLEVLHDGRHGDTLKKDPAEARPGTGHVTSLKSSFQTGRISTLMELGPQTSLLRTERDGGEPPGTCTPPSPVLWGSRACRTRWAGRKVGGEGRISGGRGRPGGAHSS